MGNINKKEIINIFKEHSRNNGDYLPDYKFGDCANAILALQESKDKKKG